MSIYTNNKKATLYKGDYYPAELYKGDKKIAGYSLKTFSGQNITMNGTYNDKPEEITLISGFVPSKNLFDISKVNNTSKITNNGDGSLTVSGYPAATTKTLGELCPSLKVGDIVTLNAITTAFNSSHNAYVRQIYFLNLKLTWKFGSCMTITQEILDDYPRFYCGLTTAGGAVFANISNIQIEYGETPTEYEPYIAPSYPVLNWNGEEIQIPYILQKDETIQLGDTSEPYKVCIYFKNEIIDITQTELGEKLLSLKTLPKVTTASISDGSLSIVVKVAV